MSLIVAFGMVGMVLCIVVEAQKEKKLNTYEMLICGLLSLCMLSDMYLDTFVYTDEYLEKYSPVWITFFAKFILLVYVVMTITTYKQWNLIGKFNTAVPTEKRSLYRKISKYAAYICILIHAILYAFVAYDGTIW